MITTADRARLSHILDAIDKIEQIVENLTVDDFHEDWEKRLVIERLLEVIGEAANRVNPELQDQYPQIPWAKMVGMRNFISHEYFRIDIAILWETAVEAVPALRFDIEVILKDNDPS